MQYASATVATLPVVVGTSNSTVTATLQRSPLGQGPAGATECMIGGPAMDAAAGATHAASAERARRAARQATCAMPCHDAEPGEQAANVPSAVIKSTAGAAASAAHAASAERAHQAARRAT